MNRNKRNLAAVQKLLAEEAEELLAIGALAEEEDRELTDDEKARRDELRASIETNKAKAAEFEAAVEADAKIEKLGRSLVQDKNENPVERTERKSFGEQFVESDGYQKLSAKGFTGKFSTGEIALDTYAATLLEGTPASPGAGGAAVPTDRRPGILPILFERLTVADLLASGTTNSNNIEYVEETVADGSAVDTVAEGADKPEVELELELTDTPVRKIAAFLPVSDEMLEDAAQIRSYLDARLALFVKIEEEDQLLNKTGTGTNLNGLLNQVPGANQDVFATVSDANGADHIFAAITVARESFLEPDGIVVNSDDWADMRLLKDANGNYIAGSPFSNGIGEPAETLWNKRVVVTSKMPAGTALVGSFQLGAQVFRRGGLTVEASNSHADFFKKNLTAIRAEERLALAVYRPQAFATADVSHT